MFAELTAAARFWLSQTPVRTIVNARRHRGLRDSDCFIASYPKSGNTWLRHVLTHALTGIETQWKSPFLEYSIRVGLHHDLIPVLPNDGRMIKTHEPYRDAYRRTVLMVRDPRDVAVSQFHYNRQFSPRAVFRDCTFDTFLDLFLKGWASVYGDWGTHTRSWNQAINENRVSVIRYEDMKKDPRASLDQALDFLGFDVDSDLRAAAINDNSAIRMREKELKWRETLRDDKPDESKRTFVRKAKSGGYSEFFTPELEEKLIDRFGDEMRRHGYLGSEK